MYTYADCLRMLEAFKSLSTYTDENNVVKNNYFGSDTFKIAKAMKQLNVIEREFLEFRDEIVKKHNPENATQVSDVIRKAIEEEYVVLLRTPIVDIQLPMIQYDNIMSKGNCISASTIAELLDLITDIREENYDGTGRLRKVIYNTEHSDSNSSDS